ncbi:MAG TPA: hypothetical protein VHB02_02910 [Acidimicrobiales bacterium]|nr:hypothetical protein [Acidimicrobiales bacterium]
MRRRALAAPALVALASLSLVLSSCGNDGLRLARQACGYVTTSIRLYSAAEHDPDPAKAAALRTRATVALEKALPLAAQANSADGQWNPLMTTLQEVGRNSEANLVTALKRQCAQAARANEQPPAVNNIPGQPSPSTLPGQ